MLTERTEVASLAEAWIEISSFFTFAEPLVVASLAEAWIEMPVVSSTARSPVVASLAEAWIEIVFVGVMDSVTIGRLPRGGVD